MKKLDPVHRVLLLESERIIYAEQCRIAKRMLDDQDSLPISKIARITGLHLDEIKKVSKGLEPKEVYLEHTKWLFKCDILHQIQQKGFTLLEAHTITKLACFDETLAGYSTEHLSIATEYMASKIIEKALMQSLRSKELF